MGTLLLFILILGLIILVHEFGHYLFARLTGVHVHEFAIGMGPKIFSKVSKKTDIRYSIRAIPLGGFVSLAGEEVEIDEVRKKYKGKTLQDKNVFQRFLVMFFGAGFNFIFAILLIFAIGLIYGGKDMTPVLSEIAENTPAYEAGLEAGDKIVKINNYKVKYVDDIQLYLAITDKSEPVTFTVLKDGEATTRKYVITAEKIVVDKQTSYLFGIGMSPKPTKGFINIVKYTFEQAGSLFKQMFVTIGGLFTGKIGVNQLSGPVGIYGVVGQAKTYGMASILSLIAFLSINVGVINLIPFPAFDGGRILFLFIEKIKGSPVNSKVENIIHTVGFILIILLIVYVTFNDILKLF